MRRLPAIVVVALLVGCGGGGGGSSPTTLVDRTRAVPAEVQAFLARVADPHEIAFLATYSVLLKLGGKEATATVDAVPPTVRTRIGDLVVTDGPAPQTCVAGDCHAGIDEARLSAFGLFSGFLAKNPAAAIEAAAKRADAGDAIFSTRHAAGITLGCISIPVQATTPSTACLTPEGIFGYVDNPTVRYELKAYSTRQF